MKITASGVLLLLALFLARSLEAADLDLGPQGRELLAVQEDLLAFQAANPGSPDYPFTVGLASAVRHAQTILVHIRDLNAIFNDYGCDREMLEARITSLVAEEFLPHLRLDLEDINLQVNQTIDPAPKDAGIRARRALREAIELVQARWPSG